MTTIAYHDNIIAVDSWITSGSSITDTDCNKINIISGVTFVFTGSCADEGELVAGYFGNAHNKDANISAFIVDSGKVFLGGIDDKDGFWKQDITGRSYAIGNGADHAITAIDLGCNARDAIKMAIKRNIYTGGKIRTYKVKA